MATNDSKEEPEQNEQPENEQADGLTAEQAAEASPYDEVEVWKKSKNTLFTVLGVIALTVAGVTFYQGQEQDEKAERSLRFMNASEAGDDAVDQFLSFAEDYDDTLGGVALYRAAALQYADRKFSDSAENFAAAAKRLQGDPLQGRALIGQAVSLIKDNNADAGVAQLLEISS